MPEPGGDDPRADFAAITEGEFNEALDNITAGEIAEIPAERDGEQHLEVEVTPEHAERVKEVSEKGIAYAYDTIQAEFESAAARKKDQELQFHNRSHTEGVVKRTEKILEAMLNVKSGGKSSPEQKRIIALGKLIAAFHDIKNKSRVVEIVDGNFDGTVNKKQDGTPLMKKIRKRGLVPNDLKMMDELKAKSLQEKEFGGPALSETEKANLTSLQELGMLGTNETESADELIKYMNAQVDAGGKPLFSERDMADVKQALMATVPGWDIQKGTVEQINLSESSRMLARAVALADLGEAGMEPEVFLDAGDALFLEDNPDIAEAVKDPEKFKDKPEEKARFAARIVAFRKMQPEFALGRQNRLEQELKGLSEEEKKSVMKVFDQFGNDEVEIEDVPDKDGKDTGKKRVAKLKKDGVSPKGSIGRALERAKEYEGKSFEELSIKLTESATKHKAEFGKKKTPEPGTET